MSKQVAKKKTAEVIPLPGLDLDEIAGDAAELNPKMGQDDMSMPYLYVVQKMSPQCDPDDPKYIEGAKPGDLYSLVTNQVFPGKDGLEIINCYYERRFVEWRTRENGGGRVTDHPPGPEIVEQIGEWSDDGKPMLPNGNICWETAYMYILYRTGPEMGWTMGIMPLKGTMLKTAKKMNSVIANSKLAGSTKPAPRWWFRYQVTTIRQEKDGNSWHITEFQRGESIDQMGSEDAVLLYKEAKALAEAVKANVYEDVIKAEVAPEDVASEAKKGVVIEGDDEEVPFG